VRVAHVLLPDLRPSIIRSISALISGGVSWPSSGPGLPPALRLRGDDRRLPVMAGAGGVSGFAAPLRTIAGPSNGTAFRFRGGRL
jgi:hypothetical protein